MDHQRKHALLRSQMLLVLHTGHYSGVKQHVRKGRRKQLHPVPVRKGKDSTTACLRNIRSLQRSSSVGQRMSLLALARADRNSNIPYSIPKAVPAHAAKTWSTQEATSAMELHTLSIWVKRREETETDWLPKGLGPNNSSLIGGEVVEVPSGR